MPDSRSTLIALKDPRSPAAEAYRTLRTNVQFSSLHEPLRTLVVTSVAPGEDKSVTLANLALTMAQGQRVILVDADLHCPMLHELFGVPNECGLATLLDDMRMLAAPPLLPVPGADRLHVLPSGPAPLDPAAQLGSSHMDDVIAALRERADVVLFDAPPILAATDAAVLGMKTDGVLLLVRAGRTSFEQVRRAQALLAKAQTRILGVALTDVKGQDSLAGQYGTGYAQANRRQQ